MGEGVTIQEIMLSLSFQYSLICIEGLTLKTVHIKIQVNYYTEYKKAILIQQYLYMLFSGIFTLQACRALIFVILFSVMSDTSILNPVHHV